MSAVLQPQPILEESAHKQEDGCARYRWTRESYLSAVRAGVIDPEARIELIEGDIIQLSPQSDPHAAVLCGLGEWLHEAFGAGFVIRTQMPLAIGSESLPEPDIAVVPGKWRDYTSRTPDKAALVVEVSDTSLLKDRTTKAGLYASAGVPEYWIVNLQDNLLEVHRQPAPMAGQPFGHHFKSIERLSAEQTILPLQAPGEPVTVRDLLP